MRCSDGFRVDACSWCFTRQQERERNREIVGHKTQRSQRTRRVLGVGDPGEAPVAVVAAAVTIGLVTVASLLSGYPSSHSTRSLSQQSVSQSAATKISDFFFSLFTTARIDRLVVSPSRPPTSVATTGDVGVVAADEEEAVASSASEGDGGDASPFPLLPLLRERSPDEAEPGRLCFPL